MSSSQGNPQGPNAPGAGGDPSMEDILASIRRILSEDGASGQPNAAGTLPPALAQAQKNVLALDSSMLVREPQSPPPIAAGMPLAALNAIVSPGMETQLPPVHVPRPAPPPMPPQPMPPQPVMAEPAPPPAQPAPVLVSAPAPMPQPPQAHVMTANPPATEATVLVAPAAAAAASASLGELVRTLAAERQVPVHRGGPTLEDIVREEMRPALKAWLDAHLPPMVERLVRQEIERMVNRSVS